MNIITKTTVAAIALIGLSASAHAADWSNVSIPSVPVTSLAPGFSAGLDTDHYVAVDGTGAYVPNTQVNDDGTFKATCVDCEWREKTAAELIDATPGGPNDPGNAQHDDPNIVAHNTVTKDTAKIGIKGATFSNDDGRKTTINKNGVKTNGEVIVKGVKVGETLQNHGQRIGSLETENAQQWSRIDANSDAIASHGVRLDELDKGLAISMAMPDAWLGDTKKFGIFGSVGGFNGETALGFAAIGRIDETWSINGKLGTDTDFEQFGWQAGFGAQW